MRAPVRTYGQQWICVDGRPTHLGFIDALGSGFGGLLQVGSSTLQAKWASDVQKRQIKADQSIGMASQATARDVGVAQQERYGTTGTAWAQAAPKIALAVAVGLVALVAVRRFS